MPVTPDRVGGRVPGSLGPIAVTWLGGILVASCILLPLDTGFPGVPLLGHPLSAAAAISIAVFVVLAVLSQGRIFALLRRRYCVIQTLYFLMLVVASLRADSLLVALHASLVYYCTFVLNYVVLLYVILVGGVHRLVVLVSVAGVVAAAIGILQGVFGVRFGAFDEWFARYYQAAAPDPGSEAFRGVGTLNNPILYGVAIALLVPYVFALRRVWLSCMILPVLLLAAGLSGSRTVLLPFLVFLGGAVMVYRWRVLWVVPVLAASLLVGVRQLGGWTAASSDPRVRFLVGRLGVGDDPTSQSSVGNLYIRKEALSRGARDVATEWGPITWLVGRGQLSASHVGRQVSSDYGTVDNAFFGVFYEKGLIGVALFLCAFLALLYQTRRARRVTLHWYGLVALLATGVSFNFDAYSTFNILAVGSIAIATELAEGLEEPPDRAPADPEPDAAIEPWAGP